MTPTYDVVPGQRVGPFSLGDSLWSVLEYLRTKKTEYPKVEVSWDDSKPHLSSTTIHLPSVTLHFPHSSTQHLSLIRIDILPSPPSIPTAGPSTTPSSTSNAYGASPFPSSSSSSSIHIEPTRRPAPTLTYDTSTVLHSATQPLTRGIVGRVLGPTYASNGNGTGNGNGNGDRLVYPGISFQVGSTVTGPGAGAGVGQGKGRDDPIGRVEVVRWEEDGHSVGTETARPRGDGGGWNGIRECRVKPGKGISLDLPDKSTFEVLIGTTKAQDLLLDLGPPIRKYWKEDERMARMWGGIRRRGSLGHSAGDDDSERDGNLFSTEGDCFWNYFQHGLDFLVSPTGEIKRIVIHSNIPGTPLFQRYARCPWSIASSVVGDLTFTSPASLFESALSSFSANQEDDLSDSLGSAAASSDAAGATHPAGGRASLAIPEQVSGNAAGGSGCNGSGSVSGSGNGSGSGGNSSKKKKKKDGKHLDVSSAGVVELSDKSDRSADHSPAPASAPASGPGHASASRFNESGVKQRGMVLDRIGEGGLDGVQGDMSSRLLGFEGLVLEEDLRCGGITSGLIYRT